MSTNPQNPTKQNPVENHWKPVVKIPTLASLINSSNKLSTTDDFDMILKSDLVQFISTILYSNIDLFSSDEKVLFIIKRIIEYSDYNNFTNENDRISFTAVKQLLVDKITIDLLINISITFINNSLLKEIITKFKLIDEFTTFTDLFVLSIRPITNKWDKKINGGLRKGKNRINSQEFLIKEDFKLDEQIDIAEIEFVLDSLWMFSCFCKETCVEMIFILINHKYFINIVRDCFSLSNHLNSFFLSNLIKISSELEEFVNNIEGKSEIIKLSVIHLLNEIIDHGHISFITNGKNIIKGKVDLSKVDLICDFIHTLIENIQPFENCVFLKNAPLIVDLNIKYDILTRLKSLQNQIKKQELHYIRLEFLITSLENILILSGNLNNLNQDFEEFKINEEPDILENQDIEMNIFEDSMISQVSDLFPDFSQSFIKVNNNIN